MSLQVAQYAVLIVKYAKDQRYDEKGIATHCGQVLHLYITHTCLAVQYTLTGTAPVHHSQLPHSRYSLPLLPTGWPSCRRGQGEGIEQWNSEEIVFHRLS